MKKNSCSRISAKTSSYSKYRIPKHTEVSHFHLVEADIDSPGQTFFEKTPLFLWYSGVNATNAANLIAKRR